MAFQLTYKATLGSKVSAEKIAANGGTISIPKDAVLDFKVKNTSGRAGAWTFAGVRCTISGTGENAGRVTLTAVSGSTVLPSIITATQTVGAATLSVNVIVFSVTGTLVPDDNFGGRANDKL